MKMFFCGFVSHVLCTSRHYNPTFSFLVSLTDPSTPSILSPVPSTPLLQTTIPLASFMFPLSSHSIILSFLPIQKEAQSSYGSDDERVLTHRQQTKKEESWALCFSLSVWAFGILQNWMTLVNRVKSYWRGTNRD